MPAAASWRSHSSATSGVTMRETGFEREEAVVAVEVAAIGSCGATSRDAVRTVSVSRASVGT